MRQPGTRVGRGLRFAGAVGHFGGGFFYLVLAIAFPPEARFTRLYWAFGGAAAALGAGAGAPAGGFGGGGRAGAAGWGGGRARGGGVFFGGAVEPAPRRGGSSPASIGRSVGWRPPWWRVPGSSSGRSGRTRPGRRRGRRGCAGGW